MKQEIIKILIVLLLFGGIQYWFNVEIEKTTILFLLVIFSLFFGSYIISLAILAPSKCLSHLYEIEDKNDNSMTLLDVLLMKFKFYIYTLLYSMLYLVILGILNSISSNIYLTISYLFFGLALLNFFNAYNAISLLMGLVRQTAVKQ